MGDESILIDMGGDRRLIFSWVRERGDPTLEEISTQNGPPKEN